MTHLAKPAALVLLVSQVAWMHAFVMPSSLAFRTLRISNHEGLSIGASHLSIARQAAPLHPRHVPKQNAEMSALSEKSIQLLGRLKDRPFFSVGRVGGSVCEDAFYNNRYLTDEELDEVVKVATSTCSPQERKAIAILIREQQASLVQQARKRVYDKYPGIDQPGGGLYPAVRAEACWRDVDKFLQCISYGTATGVSSFTDEQGAAIMGELYQEMQVPLDAMCDAARGLKDAVQAAAKESGGEAEAGWTSARDSAEHLIGVLDRYRMP